MPNGLQIDVVSANGKGIFGNGTVAQRLLASGFATNSLRTNDVLRKDEWIHYDTKVVEIARKRLVGVGDLISKGLTLPIANPLGTTRIEWETMSDMDPADVSMSGVTPGQKDRVEYNLTGVPLPIIHKDFSINIRALEASRKTGMPLDTTQAQLAATLVSEKCEEMLFKGYSNLVMQNSTIYGYTTAPNRNTGSISNWASGATTGETIVDNVLSMILALQTDNKYGPYALYVPLDYYNRLLDDFKANSDKSTLKRLMEIPDLESIKISKDLTGGASGEVILVQMSSDVVDIVDGMQPTVLQWESAGGFVVNFKVMAIMVPRFKSDAATQSGIAHFSV